jgi:hypothetical protein
MDVDSAPLKQFDAAVRRSAFGGHSLAAQGG